MMEENKERILKSFIYLIILSLFMTGCSAKPSDPNKLKADGKTIEGIVIGKKYDIHTMKAYKATTINFLQAMKEGNVKIAKSLLQEPDEKLRKELNYQKERSNRSYDNFKVFTYNFTSEEAKSRVKNFYSDEHTMEYFMRRDEDGISYKYIDSSYRYILGAILIDGNDPTFKPYRENEKKPCYYELCIKNYKGELKVIEIFNQDRDHER